MLSYIPIKGERHIFMILDEFASSAKFPDFAITISNIRKNSAGILLCVQDEMSLSAIYGEAQAHQIKTNCGIQCYLKGEPIHTCRDLSQVFGKYSYTDEKGIVRTRELMTPDEIRMTDDALILVNNQPPLKYSPTPYYQSIWLEHLSQAKPYFTTEKQIADPPLIQFS